MRTIGVLALALAAWIACPGPAAAQDNAQAVARELERKARAGEADNGFCLRVAPQLERLDRAAAGARLNQLLSRADGEGASLLFAVSDAPSGEPVCALLVFRAAAMRDGRKCRPSLVFACIPGRDCRAKTDDQICEMKPGQWD